MKGYIPLMQFKNLIDTSAEACHMVSRAKMLQNFASLNDEFLAAHWDEVQAADEWVHTQLSHPISTDLFHACERINESRRKKLKRGNAFFLNGVFFHVGLFVTFTIAPRYINLDEKTLRQRANEYLRSYACSYALNVDYGSKNNRFHIHATVFGIERIELKKWAYGVVKAKRIRNEGDLTSKDPKELLKASTRLKKYTMKLMNHATKGTTSGRMTYSKVKPWDIPPTRSGYQPDIDELIFQSILDSK